MIATRRSRIIRVLLLKAFAVLVAGGCGVDSGPTRYDVSGTVTFAGKPVPKGFITFMPDTSKGNSGPGGGAMIENGRYRTARGKGVVGGPHAVKIIGYDGIPTAMEGEEVLDGKPLFAPYHTTVDFPMQAVEQNFEVPTSN